MWDVAAQKYVRESDELLAGTSSSALGPAEMALLRPLLASCPSVVHLQSGHGLDDVDLAGRGARFVVGVDFSIVTATAALQRSARLGLPIRYLVADVMQVPLRDGWADLVYTGKGALMWLPDIAQWAREAARLLRPGGHLFLYEAHPAACLWTWDPHASAIRGDRSYFGGTRVNDSFPGSAGPDLDAVEWQWTLADVVNATLDAGLEPRHLGEYPEPFWRPDGQEAAAWRGSLPNCFSLLARRPPV